MQKNIFLWFAVSLCIFADRALAHPVNFLDATAVMPSFTATRQDLEVNYTFLPKFAFGVESIRIDDDKKQETLVIPKLNYKLFRQNELDSQLNIYLTAGVGIGDASVNSGDDWHRSIAGQFAMQADYETRRIYTLFSAERLELATGQNDMTSLRYRLGAAPYLANFNDVATWLIAQIEYTPDVKHETTVTPLVRFFYKKYLLELGCNTRGEPFAAAIVHF